MYQSQWSGTAEVVFTQIRCSVQFWYLFWHEITLAFVPAQGTSNHKHNFQSNFQCANTGQSTITKKVLPLSHDFRFLIHDPLCFLHSRLVNYCTESLYSENRWIIPASWAPSEISGNNQSNIFNGRKKDHEVQFILLLTLFAVGQYCSILYYSS